MNQLTSVINDDGYNKDDGACIHCLAAHTTCRVAHPTAAQRIQAWKDAA